MAVACIPGLGDPSREVLIEDRTDQRLVIYTFDRDPRFKEELGPEQTLRDTWTYPLSASDRRRVRVEADDTQGARVFCADYTYEDLSRAKWRNEIVRGRLCGS
jgi:hypothetical protein